VGRRKLQHRSYKQLTKAEQISIAKKLSCKKDALYVALLSRRNCVRVIIDRYTEATGNKTGAARHGAAAKLGVDYNSSVRGRSRKVGEKIDRLMQEAVLLYDVGNCDFGNFDLCKSKILEARLHPRIYFSREMRETANSYKDILWQKTGPLYDEIDALRGILTECVFGEIEEICDRSCRNLAGDVITYSDLCQQAKMLAFEYTLIYDPNKNKRTTAKWSSFAYSMIDKAIRNYIAERTRNVQVPRYLQDRYRIVRKIMDKTPTEDTKLLAALANKSIVTKKGSIRRDELYTPEEVEYLLLAVGSNVVSLDLFVTDGDEGSRPLSDSVSSSEPTSEDILGRKVAVQQLRDKLASILSCEEYRVLYLRYGMDRETGPRTLDQVVADYQVAFDSVISKSIVTGLLERAENKLRRNSKELEELKREILYRRSK